MVKYDLKNFYHCLGMPSALRPYFALPPVRAGDLGLDVSHGFSVDELVYPCCTTLPMGWSHSVFVGQSAHEHTLYGDDNGAVLAAADNVLNLLSPLVDRPLHAVYVDDLGALAPDAHSLWRLHHAVLAAYARVGLIVKMSKVITPTSLRHSSVELLGMLFSCDSAGRFYVAVSPSKVLALIHTTLHVLSLGQATGHDIARLVGSWSWAILLRRPAFAVFQHVYRFALVAHKRRFAIWPSVRQELLAIVCMAPLLRAPLSAPFATRFLASDASSTGGGVVATQLTPRLGHTFWPLFFSKQQVADEIGREEHASSALTAAAHTNALQQPCRSAVVRWCSDASPFDSLDFSRWSVIIATKWRFDEHINALELRALLLALLWFVSLPHSCSTRVFALLDSAVAFYSIRKGRSSSPALLPLIRRINSVLLAGNLSLLPSGSPLRLTQLMHHRVFSPPPCHRHAPHALVLNVRVRELLHVPLPLLPPLVQLVSPIHHFALLQVVNW